MQRLSHPTETVISNKTTRNRITRWEGKRFKCCVFLPPSLALVPGARKRNLSIGSIPVCLALFLLVWSWSSSTAASSKAGKCDGDWRFDFAQTSSLKSYFAFFFTDRRNSISLHLQFCIHVVDAVDKHGIWALRSQQTLPFSSLTCHALGLHTFLLPSEICHIWQHILKWIYSSLLQICIGSSPSIREVSNKPWLRRPNSLLLSAAWKRS